MILSVLTITRFVRASLRYALTDTSSASGMAVARPWHWSETHCSLSVIIKNAWLAENVFRLFSTRRSTAPGESMSLRQQSSVRSRSQDQQSSDSTPTQRPPVSNRVKFLCVTYAASQSQSSMLPLPPDTRMTGCQYKELFLFSVLFFFTTGATKSHTPNHEIPCQSRQRDDQHTDLLAWSSFKRVPDESLKSRSRAATAALKMVIFRLLFSTNTSSSM